MAREVYQEVIEMACEHGKMSKEKATTWVKDLKLNGRYQEDVWA